MDLDWSLVFKTIFIILSCSALLIMIWAYSEGWENFMLNLLPEILGVILTTLIVSHLLKEHEKKS